MNFFFFFFLSKNVSSPCSHFSSDEGEKSSDEKKDLREGEEKISCFQSFTAGEENVKNKEDENVIEKTVSSHVAQPKLKMGQVS